MQTSPTPPNRTSADIGALLDLKLVGDITGRFFVARYQRGYRWTQHEVTRLLDDIWGNGDRPYSLQPIVVKRLGDDEWELVDGQQRLTTIYLIFLYMQRVGLQLEGPLYSIRYETRDGSETYLKKLDASLRDENIDYFHMYNAYECIQQWFESHGPRRQNVANKLYGYLFDNVRVIWYEASAEIDSSTLFTRLNVGRIPLTDAELVKALLLLRVRDDGERADRAHELAAQWDAIERDLRKPDVWAFVTTAASDDFPTRITLLLDTLAGGPIGHARPRFHTFDTLREMVEEMSPGAVWTEVVDLHGLLMGWYEDRDLYHKIGYLVAVGQRFGDLVSLAKGSTKSGFHALLDQRIRRSLGLSASAVMGLGYDTDYDKCARLLLLLNVETVRLVKDSTERYPFRRHHGNGGERGGALSWSLEHIHAQQTEALTKADQWREWLRLHRDALDGLRGVDPQRRTALAAKIDASIDGIDGQLFTDLASRITKIFTHDDEATAAMHSMHAVTNLALLPSGANSALSNAVFEVKRRRIIELDRKGAFIPICTRWVFLKYYTEAGAQQVHFWGAQDRESYLEAMVSPDTGVLAPYLLPEEQP